ncbi:MAG TPA: glutathione binding-like protein [Phenylobacterium sp.]|nr:glutathione binding-like protein [Phenylobacterium sp.]
MDLYFSPLACSLASRISLYEAGAEANFIRVDTRAKRLEGGGDFLAINPKGQVPVLRTDAGEVLTENAAILQEIAAVHPALGAEGFQQARLREWLSFIGSELHSGVFSVLLSPAAPDAAKAHALQRAESRFAHLDARLAGQEFLLDHFTVADAYLIAVLNWTQVTAIDLGRWPNVQAYHHRMLQRAAVARAVAEERALFAKAA